MSKKARIDLRIEEADKSWLKLMGISPTRLFDNALKHKRRKKKK